MLRFIAIVLALTVAPPVFAQPQPGRRHHDARKHPPPERGARMPRVSQLNPDHVAPGGLVTIRGTDLRGVTAVRVGAQTATPKIGPRTLSFQVPDGVRPGQRRVQLVVGAAMVQAGTITVLPPAGGDHGEADRVHSTGLGDDHGGGMGRGHHDGHHDGMGGAHRGHPDRGHRRHHVPSRTDLAISGMSPQAGRPGTQVVIRGRNIPSDAEVLYSGQVVPSKVGKAGNLRFKIPADAKPGLVAVRVRGHVRPILVGRFEVGHGPDLKARRKHDQELRKRAEERWKQRRKELAKKKKEERRREYQERLAKQAQEREARRRARVEELRKKWERAFLSDPAVRAEMALHSDRLARLERMKSLAEVDDRGKLVVRIEVLMDREDERHEQRMALLKENFGK